MKQFRRSTILLAGLLSLLFACTRRDQADELRESVLDGISHVEEEIYLEVPDVPRWCDRLDLVKQRVSVGDAELYVEEEGSGTALVLINGGPGGTHHYFHPWFGRAADFARVVYYDQRGCGLSDWEPGEEGYSVDQAADDLEALRTALGAGKWVVLGYSYGGFLAQLYTIRYPESVAGLVLLGASPGMWVEMEGGRQYDYISEEERTMLREIRARLGEVEEERGWTYHEYINRLLYNNFLNGDWKRQHFYRPSRERVAEIALYEWHHDPDFQGQLSPSQDRIDFTGAFQNSPIPTLILEGEWDLTWNTDKREILLGNHPGAEMVVFENAGHGVYDEDPDSLFSVLERFMGDLPEIADDDVAAWREYLVAWDTERRGSPEYNVRGGWGRSANEALYSAYSREWLDYFGGQTDFMKIGFALYDLEDYEEGLFVFQRMRAAAREAERVEYEAMALVWQGHMLDLLGRRAEAIPLYQEAADMDVRESWQHSQFGIEYVLSPYAAERVSTPFQRVENRQR